MDIISLLKDMEYFAETNRIPIIRASERQTLKYIVSDIRPKRVLEIGTAIGYSALLIADSLAGDVHILTIELDEYRADKAKYYIGKSVYADKIEVINKDAGVALGEIIGEYDLVFLDAAKGQYVSYLPVIKRHLAKDGVLLADNILFRGYTFSDNKPPKRYRTIVKRLREYWREVNTNGFTSEIINCGDGLVLSRRKI